ncbi:glycosyltransferase [Aequorivita sp. H23M31]|uniref:Glycosyltransferase n=1 Tax=Aequorivita ciconiae TaxID=2494375 RepID=A0A410G2I3_9FLAO|nr:glycosyltransferase [Aequorivita sp. H23M31]QAA81466.1 glycosyltransferase [Aequorivita sp. H23M31]
MKLAVISHTEHYKNSKGEVVGWGPTVAELNHLAADFEEIYHVAILYPGNPPPSSLPYTQKNIHFVPLNPVGGKGVGAKFKIIASIPNILGTVKKTLKRVDVFQLRTPTGIGVFLIPYLTIFHRKKGWFKYAGNWNQKNAPLGYAVQRGMLRRQNRIVTINGKWPGQPKHCLTFENPCLIERELGEGVLVTQSRTFKAPFTFCFVGRLENAKGVQRIIDAFAKLDSLEKLSVMHFIGDGDQKDSYKSQCEKIGLPAVFHGFMEREKVFEIYKKSHFFLLPTTASEGFPKVIAEAMNFGCIPIVSNVSSIGQYVNGNNGFIISPCTSETLKLLLEKIIDSEEAVLINKSCIAHQAVFQFTFEYYRKRIQEEILDSH